ncbi:Protein mlp1 [Stygiomarasmius scandens]|uniref:Protein mlp1 n=1 Tax=Marasmiellus scandens TaxID=2682957 RepID=A0ABR1IXI2_9AGAR
MTFSWNLTSTKMPLSLTGTGHYRYQSWPTSVDLDKPFFPTKPAGLVAVSSTQGPSLPRHSTWPFRVRSKLKATELDPNTSRSRVEQFKEISQANETALGGLNATFDESESAIDAQIARLESERATPL